MTDNVSSVQPDADKVLPARVERFLSVNDPAQPTPVEVESAPAANEPTESTSAPEAAVIVEPVASSETVAPAPEFFLQGKLGQFTLPEKAFVTHPDDMRAILDEVWIVHAEAMPVSPDITVIRYVAYSGLFRKLADKERVPPYEVNTREAPGGLEVWAKELPIPERSAIVTPTDPLGRKARREMERHARRLQVVQL